MSTVQDSDILLVDRSGSSYQCSISNKNKLVDSDLLLVERNGLSYKVPYSNINSIQDTDLLLIDRGELSYKVSWSDLKLKLISFTPSGSYIVDTYGNPGALNLNTTSKNYLNTSYGPQYLWDGNNNTGCIVNTPGPGTLVWRPDPTLRPAVGVTKVEFQFPNIDTGAGNTYCQFPQADAQGFGGYFGPAYLNGTRIDWLTGGCGFKTLYDDPNNPITLTSLGFTSAGSGQAIMAATIRINGFLLIEGQT